jgi:spore germination protein YaaH
LIKSLLAAAAALSSVWLASASTAAAKQPVALFYLMETPKSEASFEAHVDKIGLLVPTWHNVDKNGLVSGAPNPHVLALAKAAKLPVMPIISLTNKLDLHALFINETAKAAMIQSLVQQAKLNGYVGFQFDFENIDWRDKDNFTALVTATAQALHKQGLLVTVAVCPNAPGYAGRGGFSKWMWEYWRGGYDVAALGKVADGISWMTYDQHTRWTPPGPVDGMIWTMKQLNYVLQYVPKDKVSLGIALYGYHWYAESPVKPDGTEASNIKGDYIDADESFPLIKDYDIQVQWDPVDQESWFWFYRDDMREWVFMPDARSFKARYEVVKKYDLAGFSSWVLGSEDPKVWDVLPKAER